MRITGRRTRVGVAAVCLALVAAACGGSDDDEGAGGQTGGQTGGTVKTGGVFRVPIGEPAAIDPYNARESEGSNVTVRLFTGLVTYDGNADLKMRPGVAESWTEAHAWCLKRARQFDRDAAGSLRPQSLVRPA